MKRELLEKLIKIEHEDDIEEQFGEPPIVQHFPLGDDWPEYRVWRYTVNELNIYCVDEGNGWVRIIATEQLS